MSNTSRPFIIAIDFDGTVVSHEYPDIGNPLPGAEYYLKRFVFEGAHLVLWTVRTQKTLKDAVEWFEERGIPLSGVNRYPGQEYWAGGPKVYAHLYIDDAAWGAPLVEVDGSKRLGINWDEVGPNVLSAIALYVRGAK